MALRAAGVNRRSRTAGVRAQKAATGGARCVGQQHACACLVWQAACCCRNTWRTSGARCVGRQLAWCGTLPANSGFACALLVAVSGLLEAEPVPANPSVAPSWRSPLTVAVAQVAKWSSVAVCWCKGQVQASWFEASRLSSSQSFGYKCHGRRAAA